MTDKNIPDIVVSRLPIYLQTLQHLSRQGKTITSSQELGEQSFITAAQVRKDLSFFGGFGKQGSGYDINYLSARIRQILKVDRIWNVALVGSGDLGHAIARYPGFAERGFHIRYVFDNDPAKIGKMIGTLPIISTDKMVEIIRQEGIMVAMITVPSRAAQSVADQLVQAGIKAILNYAPVALNVPENIRVETVSPILQLEHMTYYL
ncbi:redox-sensing transcriptional repressor Rex [Leptolinea tardivitalis]|uniref:Redox-sensing transcriptional repressor Rex n=1 Tax=Leptolinea tardivitalis TaxID=229920 RepID=A0A0P6WS09_9CHLR|nr:redox-sensing transcriptional repressor Rex [Leptolinea tardivitalis]KPL71731.1 REX family transcriptional regulator [Leptolinea tardivitalis]GAP20090.1 AT-rich DNA-binding protein [Leptolinea tardivitalis]